MSNPAIIRLEEQYNPESSFTIGRYWFGIIQRFDGYAVIIFYLLDDGTVDNLGWMAEHSETVSGCAYNILLHLERIGGPYE
jgi:hypothetical protein